MNPKTPRTSGQSKVVFLFDVDNTLLDNDRVIADLTKYLKREVGPKRARCYWTIFEQLRTRLGYADYLGALQRYRQRVSARPGPAGRFAFPHKLSLCQPPFPQLTRRDRARQAMGTAVLLTTATSSSNPAKWTAPDFMKRLMDAR